MNFKTTEGRELPLWDDNSHLRRTPGPEPHWQDSVVLAWWDLEQKIGGFHRIGHEVNAGRVALWNFLSTPEGVYKQTRYQPLREADRLKRGFGGGDESCRCEYLGNGEHVWTIHEGEVSARIVHRDHGPNVDCYPKSTAVGDFTAGHLDVPGRVSGTLNFEGKTYSINGLSVRDHGWGPRDWSTALSHRWIAGSGGEDFSFIVLSWHAPNESLATFGWVVRNNQITYAEKLDILTYTEIDGASNRGGRLRLELTSGESIEIECTPVTRGVCNYHHGICCIDVICRFTTSTGHTGICDFESSSNLQHGKRKPGKLFGAIVDSGVFPAQPPVPRY